MKWQLCFYYGGTAVLTDAAGSVVWSSADDEEFEEDFDDLVDPSDADEIIEWLEDAGYLPEDIEPEVMESDGTGEEDDAGQGDDEDEDEDDDEGS